MSSKGRTKKKGGRPYTKGELNRLIDSLCHPLAKADKGFLLVEGLLHAMVERDPPTSVTEFIRYNLPKLLEEIDKKRKEDQPQ